MHSPTTTTTSTSPLLDAEFVRALHDFVPVTGSTTCLSFNAGQVIRTLNKDDSGWWDGELEGKRGWFPSNYVEVLPAWSETTSPTLSIHPRSPVTTQFVRRPASIDASTLGSGSTSSFASSSSSSSALKPNSRLSDGETSTVLESIQQAILLLQNAVQATRVAHFQPSTACVISSVRTVLSSTDCLTRESTVLKTHPSLASSRKRILAALASLVNQARKASSPTNTTEQIKEDAVQMLDLANDVVTHVRAFLEEAKRLGVKLVVLPSPVLSGAEDKVSTRSGSSSSSSSLRSARSMGDLKSRRPNLRVTPSIANMPRPLPSPTSTTPLTIATPTSPLILRTTSALTTLLTTIHDQLLSTIAAFIGHVHAHTRSSPSSSYAHLIDMTRETIEKVREVLLVVEAVSSHPTLVLRSPTTSTHSSGGGGPGGELAVLAGCRERLYVATTALVTAARVATSAPVSNGPQAEDEERRSLLHSATAVLRSGGDCVGAVKLCVAQGGEREFELVLPNLDRPTTATVVEKKRVEEDTESMSPTTPGSGGKVSFAVEDGEGEQRSTTTVGTTATTARGKRGPHTLSMLGRKATSLSCLRDMYEAAEEPVLEEAEEEEEGEGGEVEERRGSEVSNETEVEGPNGTPMARGRTLSGSSSSGATSETITSVGSSPSLGGGGRATTPASTLTRQTSPIRTKTDNAASSPTHSTHSAAGQSTATTVVTSVPMSRNESSRTSESAASSRSALSRTSTNDTSPRSSVSTTNTDHNNKLSYADAPAVPALFSTVKGNASAPHLPTRPPSEPHRPSSHGSRPSISSTSATGGGGGGGVATLSSSSAAGNNKDSSSSAWFLTRDYQAKEISFNGDGHVTGGTLRCLIERMTLHDTTIDPTFANTFFLTFRMFTTPFELAQALYQRFDIAPPPGRILRPDELKVWSDSKLTPIRLRIYNLFKTWLESFWHHDLDKVIVDSLLLFCRGRLASAMSSASLRLVDLVQKRVQAASNVAPSPILGQPPPPVQPRTLNRMQSTDRLKAGKIVVPTSTTSLTPSFATGAPSPILSKSLISQLRSLSPSSTFSVLDIDPLELARQLTIMESKVYCLIKVEELLGQEFSKKGDGRAVNVRAMSTLSTRLTGWIAETILNELDAKRRSGLVKYFVKLSDRCHQLNNYNTLFAVLCALNSSTISRLKKTWDGLAPKYRQTLDVLRKATEHSRNYAEYRATIRNAVPPCLPFVGLFLTDITMCSEGNPAERPSPVDPTLRLINFDRYQKMARIVGDLQRFQVPYNLVEVPEIQSLLSRALEGLAHGGDATSLYRKSLLVEPRDAPGGAGGGGGSYNSSSLGSNHSNSSNNNVNTPTSGGGNSYTDFFNWKS